MILSVSRRTDIPAFFSEWFFRRLAEGYALVRHPMRPNQIARISLSRDVIDGIAFWSKNPAPLLQNKKALEGYPYYVQHTITPYGPELEPGVPPMESALDTFKRFADEDGPDRMVWRYDPILLSPTCTTDMHLTRFRLMAEALSGYTDTCVISFFDSYRHTRPAERQHQIDAVDMQTMRSLAATMASIARRCGIAVVACAEDADLSDCSVMPSRCIDAERLARIGGRALRVPGQQGQRRACHCAASVDLGAYDTCRHGCVYCYANLRAKNAASAHDPLAPMLTGYPAQQDTVYDRSMQSFTCPANEPSQSRLT